MGRFTEPAEMRNMTTIPELLNSTDDQLDELYIIPAERMIEVRFNLTINTDDEPTHWAGIFDSRPAEKTKFLNDYKRSTYILVNSLASNPHNYDEQSVGGASVVYSKAFLKMLDVMMEKWSKGPTAGGIVYRT